MIIPPTHPTPNRVNLCLLVSLNAATNLITLDDFLGKLGALSRKSGKQKVNSDADPAEEGETCAKGKKE